MAQNIEQIYRLPSEVFEYTETQLAEVYRCKNDIVYFAEKYCKIITPKGRKTIQLYDYQKTFLEDSIDHLRYILKCSRQVGKTTSTSVLLSWYLLFGGGDKAVALVSKDMAGAKDILKRLKIVYGELPKWLQMGVTDWNLTGIKLENGTEVTCFPAGSEQLRGFTVNFLYLDEYAILKKNVANDFIDTVMPTIANDPEARIVMTSTPKGHNHFKDAWDLAKDYIEDREDRKDFYKRIEVKWNDVPGRDERWKAKILRDFGGDMKRFNQEYETKFEIGGASSFFKTITLEEGIYKTYFPDVANVVCRIWKQPPPMESEKAVRMDRYYYTANIDVSEGIEGDSTVCTFFEIDKTNMRWKQIGRFTTNVIDPNDIHNELHFLFSDVMNNRINKIFIENNSFGRQVIFGLLDNYPDYDYEALIYKGEVGTGAKKKVKWGVNTNKQTKPEYVRNLQYLQNKQQLILSDGYTATEMGKFVQDGNSFYGADESPDDEVMSIVVGMALLKTLEYKEFVNNIKKGNFKFKDGKYRTKEDDEDENTQYIIVNGRRKRVNINMFSQYATT